MTTKQTILGLVVSLLAGVAIGRFTLPAKIVTKTQVVEDKTAQQDKQDNSVTTVTQTKKPDGTVTTVTQIDNHIKTDTHSTDNKDTKTDKEVTYNTARWTIAASAEFKPLSGLHPSVTYGGEVLYRVLGPIQVGVTAYTDGTVGGLLGISF